MAESGSPSDDRILKTCTFCGVQTVGDAPACARCGWPFLIPQTSGETEAGSTPGESTPAKQPGAYCTKCGAFNIATFRFCCQCGTLRTAALPRNDAPVSAPAVRRPQQATDASAWIVQHSGLMIFVGVIGLAVVLVVLVSLTGLPPGPSSPPQGSSASSRPLEESLAIIDGAQFDAIKVNRFRSVLNQLASIYPENKQQIGDMTAKAYQVLEEEGVSESLLNIMEGMNLVFPARSPIRGYDYKTTLALYMAFRDKGESHQHTVKMMTDFLSDPNARQMFLDKVRKER